MSRDLWVFGNAVQDITVEVDIERLAREQQDIDQHLRFETQPQVRHQARLAVQVGLDRFALTIDLLEHEELVENFYTLKPGTKYTLSGRVEAVEVPVAPETSATDCVLHGDSVTWGGGGLNVTRFLRQLAPRPQATPIRYTDVALGPPLEAVLHDIECLAQPPATPSSTIRALRTSARPEHHARAEALLSLVATQFAKAGLHNCLDVYLAALPAQPMLYRPATAVARRNVVFSRFRRGSHATHDKIICRSNFQRINDDKAEQAIDSLLSASSAADIGAIVLNSIKDPALFRAGYRFYRQALAQNPNVLGILAMTTPMQAFTDWLKDQHRPGPFPPFILVFNHDEARAFAERFQPGLPPILHASHGLPDLQAFGKIAQVLRAQFSTDPMPRLYITLGSRGSLGVDSTGTAVYAACYTRPNETIVDTNACGDAYCAAITLLEWAKRHGYPDIAPVDFCADAAARTKEMQYFMAVATAAAYCKATDRYGRIEGARVNDVLMHTHLASDRLVHVHDLASGRTPGWIADNGMGQPPHAKIFAVTPTLAHLLA
jgi:pfkB family carbohydrate kinase